jgi:hypothetical protein
MSDRDLFRVTLRYRDINELFRPPDVSPFSEEFREYSTTSGIEYIANELYANSSLKRVAATVLLPPDQIRPGLEQETRQAIRRYCLAMSHEMEQEERALRWRSWRALALAFVALLIFIGVGEPLSSSRVFLLQLIGDGMVIAGWVAIWFPLDSLVFGVRYHHLDAEIYRRVMTMELTIRPIDPE